MKITDSVFIAVYENGDPVVDSSKFSRLYVHENLESLKREIAYIYGNRPQIKFVEANIQIKEGKNEN